MEEQSNRFLHNSKYCLEPNDLSLTRPATEEECEQMIAECESEYQAGLFLSIDKARKLTMDELAKWRKKQEE